MRFTQMPFRQNALRAVRRQGMIINSQQRVRIAAAPLQRFLREVQVALRIPDGAVTVSLVRGAKIAEWNRAYRGQDKATDVLSFPANGNHAKAGRRARKYERKTRGAKNGETLSNFAGSVAHKDEASYLGDIAICPEVARENADESQRPLSAELRILILHGVLHLLGYDHETDTGQMERRERKLRSQFGLR